MRTQNSIINVLVTSIGQFVKLILNFVVRIVFIKTLAEDYLGLDSLFANILTMLSLAELGIGQAITYSLYKPLSDKNIEKIKSLMRLYKRAYISIGFLILIIGLSLNPFLDFFIKDAPEIQENLNVIYSIYVFTVALSYFASYKRELINADQKLYISNMYIYGCLIIMNLLQIVGLLLTKQYFVFLVVKIIMIIIENILISRKANKLYPFLKEKNVEKINKEVLIEIKKNILGAVFFKTGKVTVNSLTNIIISKFIGLYTVGLYSNYRLITNSANTILIQLFSAVTSSVGNLGVENDVNKNYRVFNIAYFGVYYIYSICAIGIYFFVNDFIILWIGEKYLLNNIIVLLIAINFFLTGINNAFVIFRDAFGLYWKGRYKPIVEVIINLVASIILVKYFGLAGVLLGTLLSNILVNFWWEALIVFKNVFKKSIKYYIFMFVKYFAMTLCIIIIVGIIDKIIIIKYQLLDMIFKILISLIVQFILYYIIFYKKEEFIFYKSIALRILKIKK